MGVYTHSDGNWFSRRGGFLALLIVFHILLLWALKSGFAIKIIQSITEPFKVEVVKEVKPEDPPPPPPAVQAVVVPPVSVPPVLVDIVIPVDPPIQVTPAPPIPGPPVVGPAIVGPAPSAGPVGPPGPSGTPFRVISKPSVDDFYPATSVQLEETGKPVVKVCWDTKGKVISSDLAEPSGKKRLDDAAVRFGKQIKFAPAKTADGETVGGCAKQTVTFKLD